jgi:hypothetical protein
MKDRYVNASVIVFLTFLVVAGLVSMLNEPTRASAKDDNLPPLDSTPDTEPPEGLDPERSNASELHVCTSGCPYLYVQAAVNAASEGDVIKVAEGTYGQVHIYDGLTQVAYISTRFRTGRRQILRLT